MRVRMEEVNESCLGFAGGSAIKKPLADAGDAGSIPGSRRSPGDGNGNSTSSILAWGIP